MTETLPGGQYRFRFRQRLHGTKQFQAVFSGGINNSRGFINLHGLPNNLGYNRLGLSVPRKVGMARTRNRIKRLIRESFRLSQPRWPQGYDVIVVVRPHEVKTLDAYQQAMLSAIQAIDRKWRQDSHNSDEQI